MLSGLESPYFLSIKTLHIQIVYVFPRITFKKFILIQQGKGQSFETFIQPFHKFLTSLPVLSPIQIPLKGISRVIYLVFFHIFAIAPDTGLDKMNFHLLLALEFNTKPNVVAIKFVDEFE